MYYLYILRCADNSLYCGQTSDIERRLQQHNSDDDKAASYTKGRRPVKLVYSEEYPTIKAAMQREIQIKKWPKAKKEKLVGGTGRF